MGKGPIAVLAATGVLVGALPALGADQTVTTSGTSFAPKTVTIGKGEKVTWNHGPELAQHNVAFDQAGIYRSGDPVGSGKIGEHTFTATGTFAYHCEVHGIPGDSTTMVGTVVVQETAPTPTSTTPTPDPAPTVTVDPYPTASPEPGTTPAAEDPPTVAAPSVTRKVRRGRVSGTVRVSPAGTRLVVSVRAAGKAAGSTTRTADDSGLVSFRVKLTARARRSLARNGRLRATLRFRATSEGQSATRSLTVTLRPPS